MRVAAPKGESFHPWVFAGDPARGPTDYGRANVSSFPTAILKAGHVLPLWGGHPWVYAQAIAKVEGGVLPGDEIDVVDPKGNFLGRGLWSPKSAIPIRIVTHDRAQAVDSVLVRERIGAAERLRRTLHLPNADTDAYRLIHAEGDGLPGLLVDVFRDVLVVQMTTLGMKRREGMILSALGEILEPRAVIDRTSKEIAKLEGFEAGSGVIRGDEAATTLQFSERGFRYSIPAEVTQKTGFYFDQRPLRTRVEQLARGRRVLDCFSFVGTFSLAAARGGAEDVLAIDESAVALEAAAEIARENGLGERIRFERKDARQALKEAAEAGGRDLVLCDPPKLVPRKGAKEDGLVAYRRLAGLGARATRDGGLLVLCSCSQSVSLDALTRALALGARDAGRTATILERHFQGADHPVPAAFPDGLYLKSLIARIGNR